MNHRIIFFLSGIFLSLMILTIGPASAGMPAYFDVTSITMELHGSNATFTVNYDLDTIARIYVLMLGSSGLDQPIRELFSNFNNVTVVSTMNDHAVVEATNVSYKNPEEGSKYFFHDSCQFGTTIDTLIVVFPSGIGREYYYVTGTPNLFFELQ